MPEEIKNDHPTRRTDGADPCERHVTPWNGGIGRIVVASAIMLAVIMLTTDMNIAASTGLAVLAYGTVLLLTAHRCPPRSK